MMINYGTDKSRRNHSEDRERKSEPDFEITAFLPDRNCEDVVVGHAFFEDDFDNRISLAFDKPVSSKDFVYLYPVSRRARESTRHRDR
jgi:hypothetical protein